MVCMVFVHMWVISEIRVSGTNASFNMLTFLKQLLKAKELNLTLIICYFLFSVIIFYFWKL